MVPVKLTLLEEAMKKLYAVMGVSTTKSRHISEASDSLSRMPYSRFIAFPHHQFWALHENVDDFLRRATSHDSPTKVLLLQDSTRPRGTVVSFKNLRIRLLLETGFQRHLRAAASVPHATTPPLGQ